MFVKFIKEHIIFLVIIISCIFLRTIPLFEYQYTLDELSGLDRTRFNSFSELIDKGVKIDAHPAFVQTLIYYFSRFFGYANWIIKLPFLLFGFAAVFYAYFLCYRHFSKQVGIISASIFSFSLIFVFYAPIARMYISGVFFSVALLFYFFEIFFLEKHKKINYFFLGLFALLSALNQHINALFAFTVFVSGLFFLTKENYKSFIITTILVIIAYLPHLPVTFYQLKIGGIGYEQGGWLPKPEIYSVFLFLKVMFGTGRAYYIFAFFILLCFITNRQIGLNKKQFFLLLLFIINYLIIYFYSIYNAPVYQNSVMLFSGVTAVILISSLLNFRNRYLFYTAFILISAVLIFKTYVKKEYYKECVKTIFEYQFERTFELKKLLGEKNVYPIFFDSDDVMKQIYFNMYNKNFDYKDSKDSVTFSLNHFSKFVAGLKTDYLVLASSYPVYQSIAQEYFPYLIENVQTQAINYKVYSKRLSDKNNLANGEQLIFSANVFNKGNVIFRDVNSGTFNNNKLNLLVDSLNEFPFDAKIKLNELTFREGQVVLLKCIVKLCNPFKKQISACVSIKDTLRDTTYFYNSKSAEDFVMKKDSVVKIYADSYCGTNYNKIKNTSEVTFFVWNIGKEKFIIKDFEIMTIDFWPEKWNFWN
jgi:hypothetical protein